VGTAARVRALGRGGKNAPKKGGENAGGGRDVGARVIEELSANGTRLNSLMHVYNNAPEGRKRRMQDRRKETYSSPLSRAEKQLIEFLNKNRGRGAPSRKGGGEAGTRKAAKLGLKLWVLEKTNTFFSQGTKE